MYLVLYAKGVRKIFRKNMKYFICFLIFTVLQSWFINGVKELYEKDMILYNFRIFLSNHLSGFWLKPIYSCVRCMSSLYGAITFFPVAVYIFGWKWELIPVFIFDACILVYLNYFFYKRQ